MGSKKKRKSTASTAEQPVKRASSQQGRRSIGGGGSSSPLAWTAEGVTVTLHHDQALLLVGCASLTVQSGELAVFGSLLTAASGSIEVCADERCSGALLLEPGAALGTVPLAASRTATFALTRATGSPGWKAQQQQQQQQRGGKAAEATSGSSAAAKQLGFEVWLASDTSAPVAAPPPLPPLWQQAAGELVDSLAQKVQQQGGEPPLIVVCGAKKVGKSTFTRCLVNSLLNKNPCVAYLDIDCGQPEFTAPGLMSLSLLHQPVLGPPHMHQRRPAATFFLGDTSPATDPVRYLQCIQRLHSWYCQHAAAAAAMQVVAGQPGQAATPQQQQQLPPLVVNTHGWVKGMGFDVLVELLQSLPVSHLVQIAAANPKKNLPPGSFWLKGSTQAPQQQQQQQAEPALWLLPGLGGDQAALQPTVSETSARSAAKLGTAAPDTALAGGGKGRLNAVEQRALQWEALAQQCIDQCGLVAASAQARSSNGAAEAAGLGVASELGDCLAEAVPFEVDVDDLEVQVLHSSMPASQLFYALNGAVVGLCTAAAPPQEPAPAAAGSAAPLPLLPCLGLGIVRAVDAKRRRLYILTAVPEEELESVAVLQLGRLELPASLLQTAAHLAPYLCLHSLSNAGTGAGTIKSRNNLLRQSQM